MNRKGFTLVELLGTIVLLAVISTISFVSITGAIKKSKVNDCKNLIGNIKNASKKYLSDNRYNNDLIVEDYTVTLTSDVLVNNGYLKGKLVDPFDSSKKINQSDVKIVIELNSNYTDKEIDIYYKNNIIDCDSYKWG